MTKENKQKKNRKIPLAVKIIVGILLGIIALFVIAMLVIWIINPELFAFIITFVIPNLPKLLTGSNMKAAWIMFTSDNAAIVEQIDANQQNKSDTLGVSAEVLAAIESGDYTEEEIARILDTKGEALAEIDAAKLMASNKTDEITENVEDAEEILNEYSPEVLAAIESGKYTEDEIKLIIETNGDAIEQIDSEKQKAQENEADNKPEVQDPVVPPKADEAENTESVPPVTTPETTPEVVEPVQPEIEPATPSQPETPSETVPEETPAVNIGEIINKQVAKLYIVKNRFVNELGSLEQTIKSQYGALPDEQQVPTSRKEIAKRYISFVSDLELECDAEVDAILAQLKSELQAVGGDVGIVDTIRTQYEEEKSLKKAYYLDVYMNGLPDAERKD